MILKPILVALSGNPVIPPHSSFFYDSGEALTADSTFYMADDDQYSADQS